MLNYFSSTALGFFSLWLPLRQLNSLRMCIDSNCLWMHSMHSHSTSTSIICTHTQTQLAHARTQALAIALSLSFSSSLSPSLSLERFWCVCIGRRIRVSKSSESNSNAKFVSLNALHNSISFGLREVFPVDQLVLATGGFSYSLECVTTDFLGNFVDYLNCHQVFSQNNIPN